MTPHPVLRRATASVLLAVAIIATSIVVLGGRFDAVSGSALTQSVRVEARIAACVADESMRLIHPGRERCRSDEQELVTARSDPGADGVAGYEPVTARIEVPHRTTVSGTAECPPGKVVLGGGTAPDPEEWRNGSSDGDLHIVASAPRLPTEDGTVSAWAVTVRNTSRSTRTMIVAAICAALA